MLSVDRGRRETDEHAQTLDARPAVVICRIVRATPFVRSDSSSTSISVSVMYAARSLFGTATVQSIRSPLLCNTMSITPLPGRIMQSALRRIGSILLGFLVLSGLSPAQPPDWSLLNLGLRSGIGNYTDPPQRLFFQDTLSGWVDLDIGWYFQTTDGGDSWSRQLRPHIPNRTIGTSTIIGLADGYVSTDGGISWDHPTLIEGDSTHGGMIASAFAVADEQHRAVLLSSSLRYYDSTLKRDRFTEVGRMAVSADGGASWRLIDSGIVVPWGDQMVGGLATHSDVGDLPLPADLANSRINWLFPVAMPDSSMLTAIVYAESTVNDTLRIRYYLGRINLNAMTSEWSELPMWRDIDPDRANASRPVPELTDIQFVGSDTLFVRRFEQKFDRYPSYIARTGLLRSGDNGRTWIPVNVPTWVDSSQLVFLSTAHGVTSNAVTYDGGTTWEPRGIPFGGWEGLDGGAFFALDSLHYYFANSEALFAYSTDAGRSWGRKDVAAYPHTIAAYRDNILIGRDYRSLLRSEDGGATWVDLERTGGLPEDLGAVWSLAYPDSASDPQRIVGLAGFISPENRRYGATILSDDGGRSWQKGSEFPIADSSVRLLGTRSARYTWIPRMFFRRTSGGTGTRGFMISVGKLFVSDDGGAGWTFRGDFPYAALEMEDSEHGVAVVTGDEPGLVATTDGGVSWRQVLSRPADGGHPIVIGLQSVAAGEYRYLNNERGHVGMFGSSDGGLTWDSLNVPNDIFPTGGSAFWITPEQLYVFAGQILYRSTDGGISYSMLQLPFASLALGRNDSYFYVAFAGNKVGRLRIGADVSSGVDPVSDSEVLDVRLVENPVRGDLHLRIDGSTESTVHIRMVDMMGRTVIQQSVPSTADRQDIVLPTESLASGRYMLMAQSDHGTIALPVVMMR